MDDSSSTAALNKKCGNISAEQKKELIDFLDKHPELRSGKFTQEFTFKKAQLLWIELTKNLNCLPGAKKDWRQWRRTWQDMKSVAKKKKSIIRNHENATGGGPAMDIKLTTEEEKIIDILGPILIEGDLKIPESNCSFVFDDNDYNIVEATPKEVTIEDTSQNVEEDMAVQYVVAEEEAEATCDSRVTPKHKPFFDQGDKSVKTKKTVRVRRLEHSINANDQLVQLTEKKIELKEKYLSLYTRDVEAKENMASSLEQICKFFIKQKQ